MELLALHSKWQKAWADGKLFEPEPLAGQPKFYLTPAFPYPNSPQHIGHARTYTTTDIYARFKRMEGKNVLFPMAFHVTGTPILAMAKRLAAGEKEILDIFDKIYGIPGSVSRTLTDPVALVRYFSQEIEEGMREMGYSIDWRRKFYSNDPSFNRFIQWQFTKLKEAGLLLTGSHPVPWCPSDHQAVGGHDTRGDVEPEMEEVSAVLFPVADGFIPAVTYRPETLPGVTNLWLNPSSRYVLAEARNLGPKIRRLSLYLSQEAFDSLSQQFELSLLREIPAQELLSTHARHPLSGEMLPILSASFVQSGLGSGLVMSVPAHAPLDFLALRDAGLLGKIKPKPVLSVPGYGSCPAQDVVEKLGVATQTDPKAEEATQLLYKTEAHQGVMKGGGYDGLRGAEAKEKISADLISAGKAFPLYVLAHAPLFCRCGSACTVRRVDNQWFINYGDEKWKVQARECLAGMRILPEGLRREFEYTIEWLHQKACTRAAGLGTRFPFDETQMIDALSDSTIYMAYYTIAPIAQKMDAEELSGEFFDYALLGNGKAQHPKWEAAREQFLYWYPLDSRHSAGDLVRNHLTFLIFNHVALFPPAQWPRQIVTNGFVTMEGKKMSKSMGNILPLRKAIAQFGPDVVRFVVCSTAELEADSDFNQAAAEGVISRIQFLHEQMEKTKSAPVPSARDEAGKWFYSRFHSRLRLAASQYGSFQLRPLAQAILYDSFNDLQWYLRRSMRPDLREFFERWALLCAPFMPHLAEEFWQALGSKQYGPDAPFAAVCAFPKADESQIRPGLEQAEEYLVSLREDILHILKLLKKETPASITLIVHAPWRAKVRALVAAHKQMNAVMAKAKEDAELAPRLSAVSSLSARLLKNIGAISGETLSAGQELDVLQGASEFISREFGASVQVFSEEQAPPELSNKAAAALPGKPAIQIS